MSDSQITYPSLQIVQLLQYLSLGTDCTLNRVSDNTIGPDQGSEEVVSAVGTGTKTTGTLSLSRTSFSFVCPYTFSEGLIYSYPPWKSIVTLSTLASLRRIMLMVFNSVIQNDSLESGIHSEICINTKTYKTKSEPRLFTINKPKRDLTSYDIQKK